MDNENRESVKLARLLSNYVPFIIDNGRYEIFYAGIDPILYNQEDLSPSITILEKLEDGTLKKRFDITIRDSNELNDGLK